MHSFWLFIIIFFVKIQSASDAFVAVTSSSTAKTLQFMLSHSHHAHQPCAHQADYLTIRTIFLAIGAPSCAQLDSFRPTDIVCATGDTHNFIDYSCLRAISHISVWKYIAILRRAPLIIKSVSNQNALEFVIGNICQNVIIMQLRIFDCFSDNSRHLVGNEGENKRKSSFA